MLCDLTTSLIIGFLPLGIVLIVETSISPYKDIANVLGIGVADIIMKSTCCPFSFNALRWFTPKRCCSSVITKPNL